MERHFPARTSRPGAATPICRLRCRPPASSHPTANPMLDTDASPPASATRLRRICVYCGSGPGSDPAYAEAARALGTIMAARGIGLVYGGGTVGLMGEIAGAIESQGGET